MEQQGVGVEGGSWFGRLGAQARQKKQAGCGKHGVRQTSGPMLGKSGFENTRDLHHKGRAAATRVGGEY